MHSAWTARTTGAPTVWLPLASSYAPAASSFTSSTSRLSRACARRFLKTPGTTSRSTVCKLVATSASLSLCATMEKKEIPLKRNTTLHRPYSTEDNYAQWQRTCRLQSNHLPRISTNSLAARPTRLVLSFRRQTKRLVLSSQRRTKSTRCLRKHLLQLMQPREVSPPSGAKRSS